MAIATLKTDPLTRDLAIPVVLLRGIDAVAQHLREHMQFFLGEWFLDIREGVPYFRDVLIKNPNSGVVDSLFRRVILRSQDIAEVRDLNTELDVAARTLQVDFIAITDTGEVLDTTRLDEPFIITIGSAT